MINENENEIQVLSLKDEDGNDKDFEIIDELDYEGTHYCALLPYYDDVEDLDNKSEEDTEILLIKLTTDENGEEYCETIDNDDEFDKVAALFDARMEEAAGEDPAEEA